MERATNSTSKSSAKSYVKRQLKRHNPMSHIFEDVADNASKFIEYNVIDPAVDTMIRKIKNSMFITTTVGGYYDSYINKAITVVLRGYLEKTYKDFIIDVDETLAICDGSIEEIKQNVLFYPELVNRTIAPNMYVVKLDNKTTLVVYKKSSYNFEGDVNNQRRTKNATSFSTSVTFIGGNREHWFKKFTNEVDKIVSKMVTPKQSDSVMRVSTMSDQESQSNDLKIRQMKHIVSPHKDELLETIKGFRNKESVYKELGIPHSMGILLYGPPGTGKTVMAHAIAFEFNMSCIDVTLDYFDKNSGSGAFHERNTVYVIDEIDSQLVNRALTTAEANAEASKMLTSQRLIKLLKAIDEMDSGSIVVATTNYPDRLDVALTRSGRFDYSIEFPKFDSEWAQKMCEARGLNLVDVIPNPTYPITPSDLERLIIERIIKDNNINAHRKTMEEIGIDKDAVEAAEEEEQKSEETNKMKEESKPHETTISWSDDDDDELY